VPLDGTLDLLDKTLVRLVEESGSEISRAEIAEVAAAVGLLVDAVDALIGETESAHGSFVDFLTDHPELR
jgi:hypothetical protein